MHLEPDPTVIVVPYDPAWVHVFVVEAAALRAALAPMHIRLEHIGSTSVPGMLAKPIIDILGAVASLEALDRGSPRLEALGYEAMGAFGIEGRRYFRKVNAARQRTHHLHVFQEGAPELDRHLAFRDYLRAKPEVAAEYAALKAGLVAETSENRDHYIDGKDPFVRRVEAEALAWWRR